MPSVKSMLVIAAVVVAVLVADAKLGIVKKITG
jgi:hypothetical protein